MPAKIEFDDAAVKEIVGLYTKAEEGYLPLGLVELAERYDCSVGVIRRVLANAGVKLRGRGRPVGS